MITYLKCKIFKMLSLPKVMIGMLSLIIILTGSVYSKVRFKGVWFSATEVCLYKLPYLEKFGFSQARYINRARVPVR